MDLALTPNVRQRYSGAAEACVIRGVGHEAFGVQDAKEAGPRLSEPETSWNLTSDAGSKRESGCLPAMQSDFEPLSSTSLDLHRLQPSRGFFSSWSMISRLSCLIKMAFHKPKRPRIHSMWLQEIPSSV